MEIVSQSDNKERQAGGMEEALRKNRGKPGREPTGSRRRGVTAPNVKHWGQGQSYLKNKLRAVARDLHC